jgi:twitching motility two-component system response regulator PilH
LEPCPIVASIAPVKRLILVSDDEPTLSASLQAVGPQLDVTVVEDRARKDKPDLIVLDIEQKGGLELLSRLKTGPATRNIPVIVVSDQDTADLRDMALEVGADGFIAKPVGKDFLPKLLTLLDSKK